MTVPRPPAPPLGRALLGYAAGVVAATLAFAGAFLLSTAVDGTLSPFLVVTVASLAPALAFAAAAAAALPCLVAERLARRLGRPPTARWFVLWGAATGLALGPPAFAAVRYGFLFEDEGTSVLWDALLWAGAYANVLLHYGAAFACSGAAGGYAYWWVSHRQGAKPQVP